MLLFLTGLLLISFSFADVLESTPVLIDYEQNPTSIEWKAIDTKHFEIIFPKEVTAEAQRVAHLLEAAYPVVTRSLQVSPKKISIILQNQSTLSNGFVTLAPRRSEFFLTPAVEPELSNTEWLKTLSIHEFRHVVQFQKSRQGINEVYAALLGEIGQALGIGLTMPPWFLEGDAVGIETALTKGGRGRLPMFERNLRALLLSGREYDYDKAHLGSFKDYIPNHYVYGYFYTSYMRNNHGELFLSDLIDSAAKSSYNPLTFYNSYKFLTNKKFEKFYAETMEDLKRNWKEKEAKLALTPYEVKNIPIKRDWTNYLYPQPIGNGEFLALKKGLSHIDQFVRTDGNKEETILYPGIIFTEYPYKVRADKLAWVEVDIDPRWGYRNYTRIKVYDLKSKKFVSDIRKTKGRLAVLDHSGKKILYVNWNEDQAQDIVVADLRGREINRIRVPKERVITSIDWLTDSEVVMVIKDMNDQKEVVKLRLQDHFEENLLPSTYANLGFITTQDGKILLESPQSGIDNIYELSQGSLHQLTTSRFGAYAPVIIDDKLVYNDYSARGMNIVSKKLPWSEEQNSADSFVPIYEKYALSEDATSLNQDFFGKKKFPVSEYSQLENSLNFHSWILTAPPLSTTVTLQALSRDVLNKFSLSVGASYNLNEQETEGFVSAAWSHYYPVFDIRGAYGGRRVNILYNGEETEEEWEEGTFELGMQVPWKRISGRFTQSLNLRSFGKVIKVTSKRSLNEAEIRDGALFSPGVQAQYSYLARLADRDLNPAWGVALLSHYENGKDITGVDMKGSLLSTDSRLYLPGFFDHHSFFHQFGHEKQGAENYQYTSLLVKPRGTENFFLDEATKYSGNYLFPLFYPDWNLSSYVYFKRVSMNLFYDGLTGEVRGNSYNASSTGWELLVDANFFRIFVPFTLGLRGSYVLSGEEKSNNYEVFITTLGGFF